MPEVLLSIEMPVERSGCTPIKPGDCYTWKDVHFKLFMIYRLAFHIFIIFALTLKIQIVMHSQSGHNELDLVIRLKNGDIHAFKQIYLHYWEHLYRIAYARLRSKEAAEEIVQDLFTRLWEKRATLTIEKSLSAYLSTSVSYLIFNYIDAQRVRVSYAQAAQHFPAIVESSPEEKLSFEELYTLLEQEINALPEQCRAVFKLRKEEEYSIKEIAQELNIAPKTVEMHLTRAFKALRVRLSNLFTFLFF